MTEELIIEILKDVFYTTFIILLPILGVSLIVGVFISIFQAATSIQEMTLTFVPKLIVTIVVVIFLLPWIIDKMISITIKMFTMYQTVIK
ncbi:flagellar biosynthetic protein FliQ [Stygiobacter electus]|uniref:Flagellar biosynthetic protein FliQ n=1 Tax=Stygiobacter electus TaxID=3032292 RepID=A0AAE3TBG0_9BACT|nr:flagellar biosynthetic protein FliQ [Stygiobacter electus]MDF1611248.1 flagellar biosynthetic protein FliQ [Stygiobacter electus]